MFGTSSQVASARAHSQIKQAAALRAAASITMGTCSWQSCPNAADRAKKVAKGEFVEPLLTCAGCKLVMYCSRSCQRSDWKVHKKDCARGAKALGLAEGAPMDDIPASVEAFARLSAWVVNISGGVLAHLYWIWRKRRCACSAGVVCLRTQPWVAPQVQPSEQRFWAEPVPACAPPRDRRALPRPAAPLACL